MALALAWQALAMLVWRARAQVPDSMLGTSVAIGNFDGVHLGHRELLRQVRDHTEVPGGPPLLSVAVTFDPHPMAVLRPQEAPLQLTDMDRRLELLAATGLDATLVLPFTRELAALSPERFATQILTGSLRARHVVVGRNFRFGHRASGDVVLLEELGRELGYDVTAVELAMLSDGAVASSSAIRSLLAAGDVAGAAAGLGRWHRIGGEVVHGQHRGRELGYPTANLAVSEDVAVPGDGVYAAWLLRDGEPPAPTAVSVGTNPTFGELPRRVEAFIIGAPGDLDLYGQVVHLDFVARLRGMVRFASIAGLLAAMADDVAAAEALLAVAPGPTGPTGAAARRGTPKAWVQ